MDFIELAKKRFSVRKYLDKPVEDSVIKKVLEAGRIAPSAVNYQPWYFIVVQDPKHRKHLYSEVYPREWFANAPVMIIICGDHSISWKRSDGKDHCDIDVAIAADHITLAAADMGLGTCWVCNFDREKCIAYFKLPDSIEPIVILPLGYTAEKPDQNRHSAKRKKFDNVVHWEIFNKYKYEKQ